MANKRIEAVLFDFDDTLCPEIEVEREALVAACSLATVRHGLNATALADALYEQAGLLWGAWGKADYYRAIGYSRWEGLWGPFDIPDAGLRLFEDWMPDYRRRSWSAALARFGVQDGQLVEELVDTYRRERRARQAPYPDAAPALDALSGRYRLGLVTNGSPAVQRSKLIASGLADRFEAVVVSGEVGAGKPDAAPFLAALANLGTPPERAVMVGNSLERDIAGAKALGIKTVWIDRSGGAKNAPGADAVIATLAALSDVIERLARS